jgi:hypothetical protein
MTVQDLIKDVTVEDLTTFARYIPTPADCLLTQTVFPKMSVNDVMWRIKNTGRYVNAAKYRSFDASVPFSDRQAWQTSTQGMLPALGQKLLVGEMELILQEVSRGADQDRLLQLLYDDVERHVEAINSRLELAAGDVLTDGKFSLVAENASVAWRPAKASRTSSGPGTPRGGDGGTGLLCRGVRRCRGTGGVARTGALGSVVRARGTGQQTGREHRGDDRRTPDTSDLHKAPLL